MPRAGPLQFDLSAAMPASDWEVGPYSAALQKRQPLPCTEYRDSNPEQLQNDYMAIDESLFEHRFKLSEESLDDSFDTLMDLSETQSILYELDRSTFCLALLKQLSIGDISAEVSQPLRRLDFPRLHPIQLS